MENENITKGLINEWLEANRGNLPINSNNWIFSVNEQKEASNQQIKPMKPPRNKPVPFYKYYSKIVALNPNHE